jgi:hypothetical protein
VKGMEGLSLGNHLTFIPGKCFHPDILDTPSFLYPRVAVAVKEDKIKFERLIWLLSGAMGWVLNIYPNNNLELQAYIDEL